MIIDLKLYELPNKSYTYQEVFLKNGNSGAAAGKEEITIET